MTASQYFQSMDIEQRIKFYKDMHNWFLEVHKREPETNELILMIATIVTNDIQDINTIIIELKKDFKKK